MAYAGNFFEPKINALFKRLAVAVRYFNRVDDYAVDYSIIPSSELDITPAEEIESSTRDFIAARSAADSAFNLMRKCEKEINRVAEKHERRLARIETEKNRPGIEAEEKERLRVEAEEKERERFRATQAEARRQDAAARVEAERLARLDDERKALEAAELLAWAKKEEARELTRAEEAARVRRERKEADARETAEIERLYRVEAEEHDRAAQREKAEREKAERAEAARRAAEERVRIAVEARRAAEREEADRRVAERRRPVTEYRPDMSGRDFELFLSHKLARRGCIARLTGGTGDRGADLLLEVRGRKIVIQAKRWKGSVGNGAVQEAHTAKDLNGCAEAWVIASSYFTRQAEDDAAKLGVRLCAGDPSKFFDEMIGPEREKILPLSTSSMVV